MLTSETTIRIDRPSRYLVQFCRHAVAMGKVRGGHRPRGHATVEALTRGELQIDVDSTETSAAVTISPWGRCVLEAAADTLTVRVEATDQDAIRRIQEIVTRDLERFGRRDNLTVTWPPPKASDPVPATADVGAMPRPAPKRRTRRRATLFAVLVVIVIAVHLGLGAGIVANSWWTNLSVGILLVVVLAKSLLIALGGRTLHGRFRSRGVHLRSWHRDGLGAATPATDSAVESDQKP